MKSIILATDNKGNNIDSLLVSSWILNEKKDELAEFIFQRLYGRYIKPFSFDNSEYISNYKNGFSIMANCCLLIETFASFLDQAFIKTSGKSERCFGFYFCKEKLFHEFTSGGLAISDYTNLSRIPLKNSGYQLDFYRNVRCALLHNGETRNSWKIVRNGPLFDAKTKTINSVKFMTNLEISLTNYKDQLKSSDFKTDQIWINFKDRVNELLKVI